MSLANFNWDRDVEVVLGDLLQMKNESYRMPTMPPDPMGGGPRGGGLYPGDAEFVWQMGLLTNTYADPSNGLHAHGNAVLRFFRALTGMDIIEMEACGTLYAWWKVRTDDGVSVIRNVHIGVKWSEVHNKEKRVSIDFEDAFGGKTYYDQAGHKVV